MGFFNSLCGLGKKKSDHLPNSPRLKTVKQQPCFTEAELERVFHKFDANGDGKISFEELCSIMASLDRIPWSDQEVEAMMKEADSDSEGFIDLAEFIALNTKNVDEKVAMEDLRQAFSVFDLDRNGLISPEELHAVLRSLGEERSQCRNGDGVVNFDEFKIMMMGASSGGNTSEIEELE